MLFNPWKQENEVDILGGCSTYKERYHQVREVTDSNRMRYDRFRAEVEMAQTELEGRTEEDNDWMDWGNIAPNFRAENDFEVESGSKVCSSLLLLVYCCGCK